MTHQHSLTVQPQEGAGASQARPQAVDPVCGMTIDPARAAGSAEFQGQTYHFCSASCRADFTRDPASFVDRPKDRPAAPAAASGLYTCPMHPEIRHEGPGSCPLCGMALEPMEVSAGPVESPELEDFSRRLFRSLWAGIPLVALSMSDMVPGLSWLAAWVGAWMAPVQMALATPVVLWGGWPLLARGWDSFRRRSLNMFSLIGLGTVVAFGYSVAATVVPDMFPDAFRSHHGAVGVYFEAAAMIVLLVLAGQVLELKARGQTSSAIQSLLRLTPRTTRVLREDGEEEDRAVSDVRPGDRVRVRPGEHVPVDGTVESGTSTINESMLTGEAFPVEKGPGAAVTAGTLNQAGSLVVRTTGAGASTTLARIIKMVSEAQRSRAPIQRLADVVSAWFVPAVIAVAALTAAVWAVWGPQPAYAFALVNAVAVLIIACPCALGLATPMSIMVGIGQGAQSGVLIRHAEALETMERVDTLVVDKTGTLTEGKPSLTAWRTFGDVAPARALALAATLEQGSEHPLAAAVLAGARAQGVDTLASAQDFLAVAGQGVTGTVEGQRASLGNAALMQREEVIMGEAADLADEWRREGRTVMFLALDGRLSAMLGVSDAVKPGARETVRALQEAGMRVIMLTGDHRGTAQAVAQHLGLTDVEAEVSPEQKGEVIRRLQAEGRLVAMAGDGVNDAPALALAQVGIAMGTGTDAAIESAGITLMHGDLRGILRARMLSRAVMRNIRQNLFFAFVYNVVGVPIAAGVFYPWFGVLLNPMIAGAAMSLSSVSVIVNALRLRRLKVAVERDAQGGLS